MNKPTSIEETLRLYGAWVRGNKLNNGIDAKEAAKALNAYYLEVFNELVGAPEPMPVKSQRDVTGRLAYSAGQVPSNVKARNDLRTQLRKAAISKLGGDK